MNFAGKSSKDGAYLFFLTKMLLICRGKKLVYNVPTVSGSHFRIGGATFLIFLWLAVVHLLFTIVSNGHRLFGLSQFHVFSQNETGEKFSTPINIPVYFFSEFPTSLAIKNTIALRSFLVSSRTY